MRHRPLRSGTQFQPPASSGEGCGRLRRRSTERGKRRKTLSETDSPTVIASPQRNPRYTRRLSRHAHARGVGYSVSPAGQSQALVAESSCALPPERLRSNGMLSDQVSPSGPQAPCSTCRCGTEKESLRKRGGCGLRYAGKGPHNKNGGKSSRQAIGRYVKLSSSETP